MAIMYDWQNGKIIWGNNSWRWKFCWYLSGFYTAGAVICLQFLPTWKPCQWWPVQSSCICWKHSVLHGSCSHLLPTIIWFSSSWKSSTISFSISLMVSDYTVHEFSFQDILRFTKPTWNEMSVRETSHLKTLQLLTFNLYILCVAFLYHRIACCSWPSSAFILLWYCYCLVKLCHTCSSGQCKNPLLPEHECLPLH